LPSASNGERGKSGYLRQKNKKPLAAWHTEECQAASGFVFVVLKRRAKRRREVYSTL
jgi:hypothetical protein